MQSLPQRAAIGGVFHHFLFAVVETDARHVMHSALQIPALFAIKLHESAGVFQHFIGGFHFDEELRYFGFDAAVARNIHLPA